MSLITGLKKVFTDFQLDIPRLEIADEGQTLIQGPSGSGKTTFVRCLCGFEPITNATWHFEDLDLMKLAPSARGIGLLPQSLDLFPHLSSEVNVLFPVEARGLTRKSAAERFELITSKLRIEHILGRRVEHLSGGEKQRVALARALIVKPRILICDEPFSSLPEDSREEARDLIRDLTAAEKIPTILVSHDKADERRASAIVAMKNGKIVSHLNCESN